MTDRSHLYGPQGEPPKKSARYREGSRISPQTLEQSRQQLIALNRSIEALKTENNLREVEIDRVGDAVNSRRFTKTLHLRSLPENR